MASKMSVTTDDTNSAKPENFEHGGVLDRASFGSMLIVLLSMEWNLSLSSKQAKKNDLAPSGSLDILTLTDNS